MVQCSVRFHDKGKITIKKELRQISIYSLNSITFIFSKTTNSHGATRGC